MKLAKDADVIVENYRSDVKHRLKVDYDTVAKDQSAHRLRLDRRASARAARMPRAPVSTRSRRAWAG
jgi:hypothetical protein